MRGLEWFGVDIHAPEGGQGKHVTLLGVDLWGGQHVMLVPCAWDRQGSREQQHEWAQRTLFWSLTRNALVAGKPALHAIARMTGRRAEDVDREITSQVAGLVLTKDAEGRMAHDGLLLNSFPALPHVSEWVDGPTPLRQVMVMSLVPRMPYWAYLIAANKQVHPVLHLLDDYDGGTGGAIADSLRRDLGWETPRQSKDVSLDRYDLNLGKWDRDCDVLAATAGLCCRTVMLLRETGATIRLRPPREKGT